MKEPILPQLTADLESLLGFFPFSLSNGFVVPPKHRSGIETLQSKGDEAHQGLVRLCVRQNLC